MPLLLIHAGVTCFLAGLCWLVQVVVYPSFFIIGPTDAWARFYEQHGRRLASVIALRWATQGISLALLLVQHNRPLPLLVGAAACAAGPVFQTVGWAVPLHNRLGDFDPNLAWQLLRVNALRTALWTGGAVFSLLLATQ